MQNSQIYFDKTFEQKLIIYLFLGVTSPKKDWSGFCSNL